MSDTPLLVAADPGNLISITAPGLRLYNTSDGSASSKNPSVVNAIARTVMYNLTFTIIEVIYTFELLSALLDSAPTGVGPNGSPTPTLFFIQINFPNNSPVKESDSYVIDATIQTKGNSALSPTYVTQVYPIGNNQYAVGFPITNFFNVSAPGAPYTLFLTIQKA